MSGILALYTPKSAKVTVITSTKTWNRDPSCLFAIVEAQGAGGGGRGTTDGTTGGNTTFGALLTANGGVGGQVSAGGTGGTASSGDLNITGGNGDLSQVTKSVYVSSSSGGSNLTNLVIPSLYGCGADSVLGTGGKKNVAASGYGGGGSASASATGNTGGGGGGYSRRLLTAAQLGASQTATIGAAGAAGSGAAAGTQGVIIVTEFLK